MIIEPVAGNMNLVEPSADFMHPGRLCTEHAVLIFDEVMTGFRVGRGRAGPVRHHAGSHHHPRQGDRRRDAGGAFGGRRDIMEDRPAWPGVSGRHPVRQPGGGGGNSPASNRSPGPASTRPSPRAPRGWCRPRGRREARRRFRRDSVGMFGLYFAKAVPQNYAEVMGRRTDSAMLDAGYFAPSAFEGFHSAAHRGGHRQHHRRRHGSPQTRLTFRASSPGTQARSAPGRV